MEFVLEARQLRIENDGYCLTIAFADEREMPIKYVTLQRALVSDEQDRELGIDKVHIEIDDQLRSAYGGIGSIAFAGRELTVSLTPEGEAALRINGKLRISLVSDATNVSDVIEQLRFMAMDEFQVVVNQ